MSVLQAPPACADNQRLNSSVVANIYTIRHQAGCTNDIHINPQLRLAAQWHADDVLANRDLSGDIGSDGSTAQDRAHAAGFTGNAFKTVAVNPALAISGIDIMNTWHHRADYMTIMSNCANTQIGVWSENSLDRTVVVAVHGTRRYEIDCATTHRQRCTTADHARPVTRSLRRSASTRAASPPAGWTASALLPWRSGVARMCG